MKSIGLQGRAREVQGKGNTNAASKLVARIRDGKGYIKIEASDAKLKAAVQ